MEGTVYQCSWERMGDRYRVWWKKKPGVCAEGATFGEADEALYEAIMKATGDGENQHEYDPPSPDEAAAGNWVLVSGSDSARAIKGPQWFMDGDCPECWQGRGPRTSAPLVLASMQRGPRSSGDVILRAPFTGTRITYVSQAFRDALTPEEDAEVEWRPIIGLPRARKKLFEKVGARRAVPKVMPASVPRGGWWCEVCGYATPPFHGNTANERDPSWFVSSEDLEALGNASFFVLGQAPVFDLCMTRERWKVVKAQPGAAGLRSYALGVVPEAEANRARPTRTWREMKGLSVAPTA